MPPKTIYYGKDANLNFTSNDYKSQKRWRVEVDRFREEVCNVDPNITINTDNIQQGEVDITVSNFQKSGHDLVLVVEISREYPIYPPFVWIKQPTLIPKATNLPFAVFSGVPCIKELSISGWSPVLNLTKVFMFTYSAFNENCCVYPKAHINTRSAAIIGATSLYNSHRDWYDT